MSFPLQCLQTSNYFLFLKQTKDQRLNLFFYVRMMKQIISYFRFIVQIIYSYFIIYLLVRMPKNTVNFLFVPLFIHLFKIE